jgi:hypothetical protein
MQSEHSDHSSSTASVTDKLLTWLRGRWQSMTVATPPYTGTISSEPTPQQAKKSKP